MAQVIVTGVTGDGSTNDASIMCRINPTGSDTFSAYTNTYIYGFTAGATPEAFRAGMASRIIAGVFSDADSNNAVIALSDIVMPNYGLGSSSMGISSPSVANSFTSGTAFQPNANGTCFLNVQSTLSGIVGVNGTVTVAMSATQGGTYQDVSTQRLLISVLAITADTNSGSIPVPSGWWVKITLTGSVTATYNRWNT